MLFVQRQEALCENATSVRKLHLAIVGVGGVALLGMCLAVLPLLKWLCVAVTCTCAALLLFLGIWDGPRPLLPIGVLLLAALMKAAANDRRTATHGEV